MKKSHLLSLLLLGFLLLSAFLIACSTGSDDENPIAPTAPTAPSAPSTTVQKPLPPSGLVNVANTKLSFHDNSNNEEGFRVYRNGTLQTALEPNVTLFTPATCFGGFKVTAYNAGGESTPTNTVICHTGS